MTRRTTLPTPPTNRASLLALAAALALPAPGLAELPPSAYQQMQDSAPEKLVIHVSSVDTSPAPSGRTGKARVVEARARVRSVEASATSVKPKGRVVIRYLHDPLPPGWTGPGPVPVLERGKTYRAYLFRGDDGSMAPVARGRSFVPLEEREEPEEAVAMDDGDEADEPEEAGTSRTGRRSSIRARNALRREVVVCGDEVDLFYRHGRAQLTCTPVGKKDSRSFRFRGKGKPSSAEAMAFLQPYVVTLRMLRAMPSYRGKAPIEEFSDRLILELESGRVSGMRLGPAQRGKRRK